MNTRIILSVALVLAVVIAGGSFLKQPCKAQAQPPPITTIENRYALSDDMMQIKFYTKVPPEIGLFTISVFDGDSLNVDVYGLEGWICAKKGFANNGWDMMTIPAEGGGEYRIEVSGTESDELQRGNVFELKVSTGNLYSYELQLCENARFKVGIKEGDIEGEGRLLLRTYDMDCGKVYVTDPKGRKYGPFKPSGNKEWGEIEMPVDNFGYWHLDFADTWMRPLLNLYKVEAAISDSSGKHPLKLFAL